MKKLMRNVALFAGLLALVGCAEKVAEKPAVDAKAKEVVKESGGHGWWCDDHGVVEDECSVCQDKVYKKLKPDEICPKHTDRAKSQCFICNPELRVKNAAIYKAKYGKEPPEPSDNLPEAKDKK